MSNRRPEACLEPSWASVHSEAIERQMHSETLAYIFSKLEPIRGPLVLAGNYFNFISAFGGEKALAVKLLLVPVELI